MSDGTNWQLVIRVTRDGPGASERLASALSPEVWREVPRTQAELVRAGPTSLELRISATDTSACRAALNTYMSWVGLVLSTERSAIESEVTPVAAPEIHSRSA